MGLDSNEAVSVSAKTGLGIDELLEAIIEKIPPPSGKKDDPLQALIVDSWFDSYVGVVMLVRLFSGTLCEKSRIILMGSGKQHVVDKLGVFTPKVHAKKDLQAGEVGFVIAGIKEISGARVGDTITSVEKPAKKPLEGFKAVKPQVYAGLYPVIVKTTNRLELL